MINVNKVNRKWLADEASEEIELFKHAQEMEYVCYAVTKVILDVETKWRTNDFNHKNMSLSNKSYIIGLVNIQVSRDNLLGFSPSAVNLF